MRLSDGTDESPEFAVGVIHAALDSGVRLLDTADVYGPGIGHNESLVARALAAHPLGDEVRIVTKGGLTRPGGGWRPNGRAKHLAAAARASLERLGRIDLYLLHAVDPKVPLATSVRALARLQRDGIVDAIGLSNVSRTQLEEARALADISAVQVALGPLDDAPLFSGLVEYCAEHDIEVLAHSPLGGPRRVARMNKLQALVDVAARHDTTPHAVALAWLADLHACIVPIPGATRMETASVAPVPLDDDDRAVLDEAFPGGRRLRPPPPVPARDGDVVLVIGMPGAGKTALVAEWTGRGYGRLNRDTTGGTLKKLANRLDQRLERGETRQVLDNTYGTRDRRGRVIDIAKSHGVSVRCVWLDTEIGDAQHNAILRLLRRYGDLPGPDDLKRLLRTDPHAFRPTVQLDFVRAWEDPKLDEGFAEIERRPFVRRPTSGETAVFVNLDAPRSAEPHAAGRIFGFAWRPAGGADSDLNLRFEDVAVCPHPAGPPRCWCRPPIPGLVLWLAHRHGLDPARCLVVGKSPADRTMAVRAGMRFVMASA